MTENQVFNKYIKPYFKKNQNSFVFKVDHSRLPDVYTCNHNGVTWIELKVIKSIPRDGVLKPEWRPGQLSWIREQEHKVGYSNVFLVIYYEPRNECRLYSKCKTQYTINDTHAIIEG